MSVTKSFFPALFALVIFTHPALAERKCSGTLTINSLTQRSDVAAGFVSADITFDSNSYVCSGMSFSKTEGPTTREAILGFAPGINKEVVKPGAKLKVEYESIYVSAAETFGLGEDGWEEKWTILGAG